MLSKQSYLEQHFKIYPFLFGFNKMFHRYNLIGCLILVYIATEKMPFLHAAATKVNYLQLAHFRQEFETHKFVCVGIENRGLGTTFRVRHTDERVLFERKFFLFSPKIYAIIPRAFSKVNRLVVTKAKLYYLTSNLIRKHLNIYYYS